VLLLWQGAEGRRALARAAMRSTPGDGRAQ